MNHCVNASNESTNNIYSIENRFNDEECLICLHYVDTAELKKCYSSCAATFHQKCWDEWIKKKVIVKCPHCREYQNVNVSSLNRSIDLSNQWRLCDYFHLSAEKVVICGIIVYFIFWSFLLMNL